MPTNQAEVDELRWKKFPVLDDGHVCLVDVMGDDQAVVQAARVSYGQDQQNTPEQRKSDRDLIRYMMSGGYELKCPHGTPFEMAEVKLRVRCPMDVWRQWIRHRTANVNEYSTRYSEAIDEKQRTTPDQWRLQSATNKQGSAGTLDAWPETHMIKRDTKGALVLVDLKKGSSRSFPQGTHPFEEGDPPTPGEFLTWLESFHQDSATDVYQIRLELGVAKEQARKDLPLSTYTESYWKCDLRNLLHFLSLRMDHHAQVEIRSYANVIGEQVIAKLFPLCWEAFQDYVLGAMTLSKTEIKMLLDSSLLIGRPLKWPENARERAAAEAKFRALGLL